MDCREPESLLEYHDSSRNQMPSAVVSRSASEQLSDCWLASITEQFDHSHQNWSKTARFVVDLSDRLDFKYGSLARSPLYAVLSVMVSSLSAPVWESSSWAFGFFSDWSLHFYCCNFYEDHLRQQLQYSFVAIAMGWCSCFGSAWLQCPWSSSSKMSLLELKGSNSYSDIQLVAELWLLVSSRW